MGLRLALHTALVAGCCIAGTGALLAADLNGAWATDVTQCKNIFTRNGNTIVFARDSDIYGDGFIIDGNRIRGRTANCSIRTRRQDGAVTHIIASCATEIMFSSMQFSVKEINSNRIERIFPGVEDISVGYDRCSP